MVYNLTNTQRAYQAIITTFMLFNLCNRFANDKNVFIKKIIDFSLSSRISLEAVTTAEQAQNTGKNNLFVKDKQCYH